jgi:hypothetical protein
LANEQAREAERRSRAVRLRVNRPPERRGDRGLYARRPDQAVPEVEDIGCLQRSMEPAPANALPVEDDIEVRREQLP